MNISPIQARTVLSLSALALLVTGAVLYAGPLNPPAGPVASTHKTLTEVEPRIAINATNTPGDADSLSTISRCTATRNIPLEGSPGGSGISAGPGCTITGCNASNNAEYGILAGSGCTITDCSALGNSLTGISTGDRCTLTNCSASSNGFAGFNVNSRNTVVECTATLNGASGIECSSYCVIRGNTCSGNSTVATSAGIKVGGTDNRIEGNNCTENERGIDVTTGGNFIVRNTCSGNYLNWVVAPGSVCLVVVGVGTGAIIGDSGGLAPGSTDPNANFTY